MFLSQQGIDRVDLHGVPMTGSVLLRLFVDSTGTMIPDSSIVFETSGYPALDSAALVGAAELKFSPALRDGEPVATAFLQPVDFRSPGGVEP